jgi:hypothetical protein
MNQIGKILILLGVLLVLAGIIFILFQRVAETKLLPGTLLIELGNTTIFIPVLASIIASIVLTLFLNLISRLLSH